MSKLLGSLRGNEIERCSLQEGIITGNHGSSGFLNEEIILVNNSIFLREKVHEYVTHSEIKANKHKIIGNFLPLS